MIGEPAVHPSTARSRPIGSASWLVPARVDQPELLDLGQGTPEDARQSLADLWWGNRFLGGLRSLTRHLYPRLAALNRPATCLDLGTGSAQIALAITRWARKGGLATRVLALDLSSRHLEIAQTFVEAENGVRLIQGDALNLPFVDESVDYVISSLFLHHFNPDQLIQLLRASYARARCGLIMSDLIRHWLPLIGFKLIRPWFRSPITHRDGEVSLRRAYTPDEFRALARDAGLANARVYVHIPWRMTLVVDK